MERGERALVTTLTKKMAEDLADHSKELGVKVQYLHSEVDTLERVAILRDLRLGVFDVLVGINLLRKEGIDLPEAAGRDPRRRQGGLPRSAWSLIQMIGRAVRNVGGEVIMYADSVTESMQVAIDETNRRRAVQETYNVEKGIEPTTIVKGIHDLNQRLRAVAESIVYARNATAVAVSTRPIESRSRSRSSGWRPRCARRPRSSSSNGPQRSGTRSNRSGCASWSRTHGDGRARRGARRVRGGAGDDRPDRGGDCAGPSRAEDAAAAGPPLEVTSVTVLPAEEEPAETLNGEPGRERTGGETARLAAGHPRRARRRGRLAGALADRPTWDRTVT